MDKRDPLFKEIMELATALNWMSDGVAAAALRAYAEIKVARLNNCPRNKGSE